MIAYIYMPLYSMAQYFHKPSYFKLYFLNILCVPFSFSAPWEMFSFSSIWFIHFTVINNPQMCFCRERMKRELITYCLGHFPSIFNNSMTVWQPRLAPVCPLWQWVYHYQGTKASHPATSDNIFMHQQLVSKMLSMGYRQTG